MEGNLYRMQMLMDYDDLDALKRAEILGSRKAYFEALTKFTTDAPKLMEDISISDEPTPEEQNRLDDQLGSLKNQLAMIGAFSLLWRVETLEELKKTSGPRKLGKHINLLKSGVAILRTQIMEAQVSTPEGTAIEAAPHAAEPTPPEKATAVEGSFTKLRTLIENFELDGALSELKQLMRFSYGNTIDASLTAIGQFLVRLDYENSAKETERLLSLIREEKQNATGSSRPRILAIDDVPDVLYSIKSVLQNHYAVYCVTNHMAALKYLTANAADLILLDIEMPDMNGFTLLDIIRKIDKCKTTPVLFLTGSVSVENVKKTVAAGGNDFIKKPIDPEILLSRIHKHLLVAQSGR